MHTHNNTYSTNISTHQERFNPLTKTAQQQIGTLAVDSWTVTFGIQAGRAAARPSLVFAVPNATAHPSTASAPIGCGTVIAFAL